MYPNHSGALWTWGSARNRLAAPSVLVPVVFLAAVLAAVGTEYVFVRNPDLFTLDLSPSWTTFTLLVIAGALCAVAVHQPTLGYAAVIAIVYLNLSEVLVRFHGFPSLLQILALPLLVAALIEIRHASAARRLINPLTVLLVLYALVLFGSTTYARDQALSDESVREGAKSLAIFVWVATCAASLHHVRRAVTMMVLAAALLASLGMFQVISGDFGNEFGGLARVKDAQIYADVFEPRLAGPLGDPNYFAQILLVTLPLGLMVASHARARWLKGLMLASVTVILAGTILTYSRGAALALLLTAVMLIRVSRIDLRGAVLAVSAVLTAAILLLPSDFTRRLATIEQLVPGNEDIVDPDSSFEKRRLLTTVAWEMFLDHPLVGVGGGNYADYFNQYADQTGSVSRADGDPRPDGDDRQYPHNLYLEVAAETGLIGLLAFGTAVAMCLVLLSRARARFLLAGAAGAADLARGVMIALGGYLACGLFLHGHFQRYLWLLFGLAAALYGLSRDGRTPLADQSIAPSGLLLKE